MPSAASRTPFAATSATRPFSPHISRAALPWERGVVMSGSARRHAAAAHPLVLPLMAHRSVAGLVAGLGPFTWLASGARSTEASSPKTPVKERPKPLSDLWVTIRQFSCGRDGEAGSDRSAIDARATANRLRAALRQASSPLAPRRSRSHRAGSVSAQPGSSAPTIDRRRRGAGQPIQLHIERNSALRRSGGLRRRGRRVLGQQGDQQHQHGRFLRPSSCFQITLVSACDS